MPVRYTRPLDGGWGWAVVGAVFMIGACSLGVMRSFGVFFEEFTTQFDQSAAATSWIISVCLGLTFGGTLLGVMLSATFGFRPVAMVGGVLAATGCILTSFSTSIVHLYITVGVLVGLGSSLAMFPSLSLVGKYFDKKRAIANGIAFSGVGVGNIVFPLIFTYLIEEYGWRGSFLIAAGVMLNITAFAALLRPIHLAMPLNESESLSSPANTEAKTFHAYVNEAFSSEPSDIQLDQPVAFIQNNVQLENIHDLPPKSETLSTSPVAKAKEIQAFTNEAFSSDSDIQLDQPTTPIENNDQQENIDDLPTKSESLSPSLEAKAEKNQACTNEAFSPDLSDIQLDQPKGVIQNNEERGNTEDLQLSNKKRRPDHPSSHGRTTLAEFKTLLTNPSLVCFITAQMLFLGFGLFIPVVHITPRARHLGIEQYQSAFLVSMISIGDLIGRLLSGILPTNRKFRHLHWYILLVLATGISCLLSPLAKTYPALAVYCITIGLLVGAGLTLSMTLLADLVGPTRLSDGMGLMTLLMSVSIIGAPPIAGKLYDATENYNMSFIVAGCAPVLGGLIAAILLCLGDENVRRVSVNGAQPSVDKSDTMDVCENYEITRL
ncbi:monocarboxylate transporter 13-like isoform X2 [Branchiostoma floridae]|uniref:Monocarboxylate transporter 13-like isoform X2 n=2 Tax=Branchiostoma floridae TaxID=7739 RepID=A0A9J7LI26_BRAFL|nr:monocarboxylate transporter 13-like isoform X2 [Branchiostoma floridae]XP_035683161.1 monocarboxylate transporter 13-like isoform X2 [Branchiostoma floridae]